MERLLLLSNFDERGIKTMTHFGLTNCIAQSQAEVLRAELDKRQYTVLELHGEFVYDKISFLRQAATDLPQPPDLISRDNWDAFADSLWWGLAALDGTKFAIIWTNAQNILRSGLGDLLIALSCFTDIANSIRNAEHGFPRPSEVIVFLLGDGPNFPILNLQLNA